MKPTRFYGTVNNMKKYIFTEAQLKKIIDSEIDERSRSLANTRKKRLFPKSAMDANPDRFKEYDKEVKDVNEDSPSPSKVATSDGKYQIFASGGYLKDNWGNLMCTKVSHVVKIFAQGIKSLEKEDDGSITIVATDDIMNNRRLDPEKAKALLFSLRQGKDYTFKDGAATITIGKGVIDFCKTEWKKKK